MKSNKGFTLIEILGVIVLLTIIMLLAIPNIMNTIDKNRRTNFVTDANSFLSSVEYQLSNNNDGPADGEILKIKLNCLDNEDLLTDPYGNPYDLEESFVIVVKKDDRLVYYVNLISRDGNQTQGVYLTEEKKIGNLKDIQEGVISPTDDQIREITGVNGPIRDNECFDTTDNAKPNLTTSCNVYYDSDGTQAYQGEWTDLDLYLRFTTSANYKYEITNFKYKLVEESNWKDLIPDNNMGVVHISTTTNNKKYQIQSYEKAGNVGETTCNVGVRIDKVKINSATLSATTEDGNAIEQGVWTYQDVILKATMDPVSVISGYYYTWYKDGVQVGKTTVPTYQVSTTGNYHVVVTNGVGKQKVTSNTFVVKIDKVEPVLVATNSPLALGNGDYDFLSNITVTFGDAGGNTVCDPASSLKTGTYTVNCTASGGNGLTTELSFTVRHSYAATYNPKTCQKTVTCKNPSDCFYEDRYDGRSYTCYYSCNDGSSVKQSYTRWDTEGTIVSGYGSSFDLNKDYDCSYYTCPYGGTASGSTCYY